MKCWTCLLLCAAAFCAETDPFVGKWEIDRKASKFEPQYEVIEALGNNRFRISEGPAREPSVNSFTADGSETPANFERTLSVKPEGEKAWRVLWKMKSEDRDESTWAVSSDGRTLTQVGTYSEHDGKTHAIHNAYKRMTGEGGLVGKWELTDSVNPPGALRYMELRPYEGDGLSFAIPSGRVLQNMKFDGKEYPDLTTPTFVSFGSRPNPNTLETTDKLDGKVYDTTESKISPDRKILTMTVRDPKGAVTAVWVYQRITSFPSVSGAK